MKSESSERRLQRGEADRLTTFVVIPADKRGSLVERLQECEVQVLEASSCQEAYGIVKEDPGLSLIFTTLSMKDGSWRQLLVAAMRRGLSPQVVLCMPEIDGGWVDLREQGVWDFLVEPYEMSEIQRVLKSAAWHLRHAELVLASRAAQTKLKP